MNEKILNDLQTSNFGNNKCFLTIIKTFIEKYVDENSRINVLDSEINVKADDKIGSRVITFSLKNGNLFVVVDRMIDLRRYHDVIEYDQEGIMMKRTSVNALVKESANKLASFDPEIVAHEFENLGEEATLYTGMIFQSVDIRKIERPDNYGLVGNYSHKNTTYDDRGIGLSNLIEGNFNVLETSSLSNLEFPDEKNIKITNQEKYDDTNNYAYPNSRSL